MSYVNSTVEYGRTKRTLDGLRFTADLAKALGGEVAARSDNMAVASDSPDIVVGDELCIRLNPKWNDPGKVTLWISEHKRKWLGSDEPSGSEFRWPEITVSADRPMAALAKDVQRRLIEPAKIVKVKRQEHASKVERDASTLRRHAERLRRLHSGRLEIRDIPHDERHTGTFFNKGDGVYLNGRFYSDGRVQIDRIGALTAEQFDRVLAALK